MLPSKLCLDFRSFWLRHRSFPNEASARSAYFVRPPTRLLIHRLTYPDLLQARFFCDGRGAFTMPHPAVPEEVSPNTPVSILESVTHSLPQEQITQEKLLLKLDELVSLPDTFAVVHIGGHQYKITKGDQIMVNTIRIPVQTRILLDKVLLLGSKEYTVIGQPMLTNVKVLAEVEEHEKTQKVIIFKKKRRKNYQRKTGHRQGYTLLRILDVMGAKVAIQST